YSATRCVISSLGWRIDFATDRALEQAWIEVREAPIVDGTQLILLGVELPGLANEMTELCRGFSIPVEFNGKEIPRPHAINQLSMVKTEIGDVFLAGADDGKSTHETMVYLQGFCVHRPAHCLSSN